MSTKKDKVFYIQILAIGVLAVLLFVNLGGDDNNSTIGTVSASEVIPTGTPRIYGEERGISYDDVSPSKPRLTEQTIATLAKIDTGETLTGEDLQRYIDIVSQISCEYCCTAESIIFADGRAACGCSHSYAMRGLAKYLILHHGDEFTDSEILAELGKWKVLFFPGIHENKAEILEQNGIDSSDYVNLASSRYMGIEKGQTSGGMVGDC